MLAARAFVVRPLPHPEETLGSQHHILPPAPLERPAHDLLGDSLALEVRRVDEIPSDIQEPMDDLGRTLVVAATVGSAEGKGTQGEPRNQQTGLSQIPVLHLVLILVVSIPGIGIIGIPDREDPAPEAFTIEGKRVYVIGRKVVILGR